MKYLTFINQAKRAILLCALLPTFASAGLFDDDEARKAILDLRTKVAALSAKLDAKLEEKADKMNVLELNNQNEQLRSEIAGLRGQIEVLVNDLANAQKRQQDFYVDLDRRLRALEPQKVSINGQEVVVDQIEQRAFDGALAMYKAGQFPNAATAFAAFSLNYPSSIFNSQAQYWLSNAYYAQRDWKNALLSLQALLKNFPDHPKAADAMLNMANCQLELKDKKESRKILEAIIAQFPGSDAAQAAKNRLSLTK